MVVVRTQLECIITVFFIEVDKENGCVHFRPLISATSDPTFGTFSPRPTYA